MYINSMLNLHLQAATIQTMTSIMTTTPTTLAPMTTVIGNELTTAAATNQQPQVTGIASQLSQNRQDTTETSS